MIDCLKATIRAYIMLDIWPLRVNICIVYSISQHKCLQIQ
jgi:hypothetical protein